MPKFGKGRGKGKTRVKGPVGGPAGVRVLAGGASPEAAAPRATRTSRASTAGYKSRMGKG